VSQSRIYCSRFEDGKGQEKEIKFNSTLKISLQKIVQKSDGNKKELGFWKVVFLS
jgi:hypothetical protein